MCAPVAADRAAERTTSRELVDDGLFHSAHPDGEGQRVFVTSARCPAPYALVAAAR